MDKNNIVFWKDKKYPQLVSVADIEKGEKGVSSYLYFFCTVA